ncbi:MAG: LbtU family siderophore porin [Desulfobulbales bacterium]
MKKKLFIGAALGCSLLASSTTAYALSSETEALLKLLEEKKVITPKDAESFRQTIEEDMAAGEEAESFRIKTEEEIRGKEVVAHEESLLGKINERVTLSGVVEVEAFSAEDFNGADTSDITLATVGLGLDAEITEWVNAHILLLYEEDDTEPMDLDEGTITLGNLEKFPLYLNAGKMYVPFGSFESNMISDPLTLELGETRESAALVGFEVSDFYGSLYAFNSDINETGDDDKIASFGANAGYGYENDNMSLDIGADWINNIAATDIFKGYFGDAGITAVQDYPSGLTAHLTLGYGPFMLIGEYLGALDAFQTGELDFNGRGAEPSAWNLEAAYTRESKGKETTFAVGYQKTGEALALELPEERILASIGVEIWKYTSLALEYLHDEDYSVNDGGTGNDANAATLQLAVVF